MSIRSVECCCAEFPTVGPAHERGPGHLWLRGQAGIRRALDVLRSYLTDSLLYHGGVHVDGRHVVAIFDDNGAEVFPFTPQFPTYPPSPWVPWIGDVGLRYTP